jgi:hypothetical protein
MIRKNDTGDRQLLGLCLGLWLWLAGQADAVDSVAAANVATQAAAANEATQAAAANEADEAAAKIDLPRIMELQRAYIEANGGLANIQELSSLIASGEISDAAGESRPFKLYRKRPDLMRMQVELPSGLQVTGFDGSEAYKLISRMGAEDQMLELSASERLELKTSSTMDGPFFQLRGRPDRMSVVAEAEINGEPAYEIVISESVNSAYERIWLSQDHLQEVKLTRALGPDANGAVIETIYFSDFEQIRGIWVAKRISYERNGAHSQTVQIDRLRVNVGIFDSFFAKPKN